MTEVFEQVCPTYLAYGMSWEQFWFGDPYMVIIYRDAYILKRRAQNENLWLQGIYFYNALGAALNNCFSKQERKYIEKPLDAFPKTRAEKRVEKINAKKRLIAYLNRWAAAFTKQQEGVDKNAKP